MLISVGELLRISHIKIDQTLCAPDILISWGHSDVSLPIPKILEIHCTLAKILHASGMLEGIGQVSALQKFLDQGRLLFNDKVGITSQNWFQLIRLQHPLDREVL